MASMQYHENGFRSGDPAIKPERAKHDTPDQSVDVLIVGCGPAGLTLAAQLCQFDDLEVCIAERKPGPLEVGQADGIACRSIEMFQAFGFAEKVKRESYWVSEVAFWRPEENGTGLTRVDRIDDVEDDLSEMPHVILSQARVHDFYLEIMANSAHRLVPRYNRKVVSVTRHKDGDYPIEAVFEREDMAGEAETIRAKYIVGCDGAHSTVRAAMGHQLRGDSARQLWGVMDVLPRTTFPDIRLKCAIQSAEAGSILIIPREGGYMVRLYIELDALAEGERARDRGVTSDQLVAKAKDILAPFDFDVAEIAWWSAYEIGQRVCDGFDDSDVYPGDPRMFIAGDACHTHSPKAGQGMNVSMADAFNLGWKLAAVLRGQSPDTLLATYSEERQAKAKELIDFDRDMARLFSEKPKTPEESAQFQAYFQKHGRYTAGVETQYEPSLLTGADTDQALAAGLVVGKRFHSAPVVRLGDARHMQLVHAFEADGRWRVVVFAPAGDEGQAGGAVATLLTQLAAGIIARVTPEGANPDAVIDLRAVFQTPHREMDLAALPAALLPKKGRYGLTDYEKAFCPAVKGPDIFDLRGIDRARGALVLVRPDQFVAEVLPYDGIDRLEARLSAVLCPGR